MLGRGGRRRRDGSRHPHRRHPHRDRRQRLVPQRALDRLRGRRLPRGDDCRRRAAGAAAVHDGEPRTAARPAPSSPSRWRSPWPWPSWPNRPSWRPSWGPSWPAWPSGERAGGPDPAGDHAGRPPPRAGVLPADRHRCRHLACSPIPACSAWPRRPAGRGHRGQAGRRRGPAGLAGRPACSSASAWCPAARSGSSSPPSACSKGCSATTCTRRCCSSCWSPRWRRRRRCGCGCSRYARARLPGSAGSSVVPAEGWFRDDDNVVELVSEPAANLTLEVALEAALRCAEHRPGASILDWLSSIPPGPLRWTRPARQRFFELIERGGPARGGCWPSAACSNGPCRSRRGRGAAPGRRRPRSAGGAAPAPPGAAPARSSRPRAASIPNGCCWPPSCSRPPKATTVRPVVVARKLVQRLDLGAGAEQSVAGLVSDAGLLYGASRRLDGLTEESVLQLAAHLGSSEQARALYLLTAVADDLDDEDRRRLAALEGLVQAALAHPELVGRQASNTLGAAARRSGPPPRPDEPRRRSSGWPSRPAPTSWRPRRPTSLARSRCATPSPGRPTYGSG